VNNCKIKPKRFLLDDFSYAFQRKKLSQKLSVQLALDVVILSEAAQLTTDQSINHEIFQQLKFTFVL